MPDPRQRLAQANHEPTNRAFRAAARFGGWLLRRITKQDWRPGEQLPATGGLIVVANHVSNFDPVALSHFIIWAGRWPRFLAKRELWDVPLLGRLMRALGQIPVDRNTHPAADSLRAAAHALERGQCVVIYPEGTITTDPDGWPMTGRRGAALLASMTGCPVVPIAQWGPQEVMGFKKPTFPKIIPRRTMHVIVGRAFAPIKPDPIPPPRRARILTNAYMQAITELLGDLRGLEPPQDRYDPRLGTRVPQPGTTPGSIR